MMFLIWQSLYLLAPAYLANMSATLASKLKILPQPLDHNKKIIKELDYPLPKTSLDLSKIEL